MAINTYFKNIANAIREKTGGSALITPGQMPNEILNIISGTKPLEPLHTGFNEGYIDGVYYYPSHNDTYNSYIYDISNYSKLLVLCKYNDMQTARFRVSAFPVDLYYNYDSSRNDGYSYEINNTPQQYMALVINTVLPAKPYLIVYLGPNALTNEITVYNLGDLI